jgi:uncharacterized protein YndB with AHSA1/START domain
MTETQKFVLEYDLPQPPSKVWRVLTEPPLLAQWLMENDMRPNVGHQFTFRAEPTPGWDGVVHCEVLEVDHGRRLRYSWRGGSGEQRLDTTVTWTLTPSKSGGTLLRLEHAGFTDKEKFAYQGMSEGWRGKVGERLRGLLAKLD